MTGRARVLARDILAEAVYGVVQRPWRSALTALGTVLGVAVLIIVLGLTSSAAAQIGDRFNPVTANEVVATVVSAKAAEAVLRMPADATERAMRITGVRTAGIGYPLDGVEGRVSRTILDAGSRVPIFGASAGFLEGVDLEMKVGTRFSGWHDANASRVVLLGPQAARALGYGGHHTGSVVWIDGVRFTVAGVISDVAARPELLSAAIIPASTARALYPAGSVHQNVALRLTTDPGAARVVGDQLSLGLDPTREASFEVSRPPEIDDLREGVASDLTGLLVLLGGVSLVIGLVGIANTSFVAVIDRTPEIGVRRAIGAHRSHITAQFLIEATILGTLGGICRSSRGSAHGRARLPCPAVDGSARLAACRRWSIARCAHRGPRRGGPGLARGADRTNHSPAILVAESGWEQRTTLPALPKGLPVHHLVTST